MHIPRHLALLKLAVAWNANLEPFSWLPKSVNLKGDKNRANIIKREGPSVNFAGDGIRQIPNSCFKSQHNAECWFAVCHEKSIDSKEPLYHVFH